MQNLIARPDYCYQVQPQASFANILTTVYRTCSIKPGKCLQAPVLWHFQQPYTSPSLLSLQFSLPVIVEF